jgi:hypothetical protein
MRVTMAVRVIDPLFCSFKRDRLCHSKALLKGQANAELRKLLNIGHTDDRPETDVNYSFAQLPPATEPDSSE